MTITGTELLRDRALGVLRNLGRPGRVSELSNKILADMVSAADRGELSSQFTFSEDEANQGELAQIGEWLYDLEDIKDVLIEAGYVGDGLWHTLTVVWGRAVFCEESVTNALQSEVHVRMAYELIRLNGLAPDVPTADDLLEEAYQIVVDNPRT